MILLSPMDIKQPVSQVTFVAFDFETTGLYPTHDEIIELGAVKFRGGQVVGNLQRLVDPGRPIPPDAGRVSGITDQMVAGQPRLSEVLPEFMSFISGAVLIAHNAGFDLGFLRDALVKSGLSMPENLVIDTQTLAKKAFPGQKSYSLQNLVAFLKFPPNQAHRALDDSIMCMKLFNACADRMSFMGDIPLADVVA